MSQFTLSRGERYSMVLEVQHRNPDGTPTLDLTGFSLSAIVKTMSGLPMSPAPEVSWLNEAPDNSGPSIVWPLASFRWPATNNWPEGMMSLTLALTSPNGDTIFTSPTSFMVQ